MPDPQSRHVGNPLTWGLGEESQQKEPSLVRQYDRRHMGPKLRHISVTVDGQAAHLASRRVGVSEIARGQGYSKLEEMFLDAFQQR